MIDLTRDGDVFVLRMDAGENRFNPENLGDYYVRSATGGMVPLSAVISVETRAAAVAIEHGPDRIVHVGVVIGPIDVPCLDH